MQVYTCILPEDHIQADIKHAPMNNLYRNSTKIEKFYFNVNCHKYFAAEGEELNHVTDGVKGQLHVSPNVCPAI